MRPHDDDRHQPGRRARAARPDTMFAGGTPHFDERTGQFTGQTVAPAVKARIERWLAAHGRNEYGDPQDTMYAGGSPLFDERTGRFRDRYEYILSRHPELADGE